MVIVNIGKYFLCDPCYVVPDEDWMELIKTADYFSDAECIYKGHQIISFSTAYGDGSYNDQFGNEFPVDSGMIGLVPVEFGVQDPNMIHLIVEFTKPTKCFSEDGKLHFGKYIIDTDPEIETGFDDFDEEEE